jgi:hypothetical protein
MHGTELDLGEAELTARRVVYRDRWFAPRHMVSVLGGFKLPTAPIAHDPTGQPLDTDAQPGTGWLDAVVGLSYAYFDDPRSAYVSLGARLPTVGRAGLTPGPQVRGTIDVQEQMETAFAFRLGVDARYDARAKDDGMLDPNFGGFIGFVSPALLLSPKTDLLLDFTIRIPVVNRLRGSHHEGPILSAGLVYDL